MLTVTLVTDIFIAWLSLTSRPSVTTPASPPGRSTFTSSRACSHPPMGPGGERRYSQVHRDRLRLIRQLQDQHLPLAEIRKQIEGLSQNELSRLAERAEDKADARAEAAPAQQSAADYIRSVLSGQEFPDAGPVTRHSLATRTPPLTTPVAGHVSPASAPNGSASLSHPKLSSTCDARSRA